jgi:hypothetical protein
MKKENKLMEEGHKDKNRRGGSKEKGVKQKVVEDCYLITCDDV